MKEQKFRFIEARHNAHLLNGLCNGSLHVRLHGHSVLFHARQHGGRLKDVCSHVLKVCDDHALDRVLHMRALLLDRANSHDIHDQNLVRVLGMENQNGSPLHVQHGNRALSLRSNQNLVVMALSAEAQVQHLYSSVNHTRLYHILFHHILFSLIQTFRIQLGGVLLLVSSVYYL